MKLFTIENQGDRCLVQYNEEETEAEGLEEAALVGEEEAEERPLVALMEQLHQVHEEQRGEEQEYWSAGEEKVFLGRFHVEAPVCEFQAH